MSMSRILFQKTKNGTAGIRTRDLQYRAIRVKMFNYQTKLVLLEPLQ